MSQQIGKSERHGLTDLITSPSYNSKEANLRRPVMWKLTEVVIP